MPAPGPLVVKNSSKMRERTSGAIRQPVSPTEMRAAGGAPAAPARTPTRTLSTPPPGMASRALSTRFASSCSRLAGSP